MVGADPVIQVHQYAHVNQLLADQEHVKKIQVAFLIL
jgi:hypothetical protein